MVGVLHGGGKFCFPTHPPLGAELARGGGLGRPASAPVDTFARLQQFAGPESGSACLEARGACFAPEVTAGGRGHKDEQGAHRRQP